ncbi:MAG TPA: hypothetical protein VJY86_03190 [Bacilli bacterium]|nr:hypothetical protein [Bacilli bacterium]
MTNKKRNIISLVLKALLATISFNGVLLSYLQGGSFSWHIFLYFTIQSNIWIGIISIIVFIFLAIDMAYRKISINRCFNIFEFIFTVSILITGIIFTTVLVPTMGKNAWSISNILTHLIAPILAVTDFLFNKRRYSLRKWDIFYPLIPLGYYLLFSLLGFFFQWDFGSGNNYPYFFLNYASPSGVFGFSNQLPYFMGSFYWIVLIIALTLSLSIFLKWLTIKVHTREQQND